jgi:hypothetical protein
LCLCAAIWAFDIQLCHLRSAAHVSVGIRIEYDRDRAEDDLSLVLMKCCLKRHGFFQTLGKRRILRPTAAIRKKTNELKFERLSQKGTPVASVVAKWASDKRLLSRVYGAAFLLRAARARGRNLRSPRIKYST